MLDGATNTNPGPFCFYTSNSCDSLTEIKGFDDIVVAKYTENGTLVWTRLLGGLLGDIGQGISTDASGSVYVTGYSTSATLGGTTSTNPGSEQIVVAKFTADGTLVWTKFLGSSGSDRGQGIAIDKNGSVYVTGYFNSATIDGAEGAGDYDIIVVKYT
jgi:hypothetical protein